MEGDTLRWENVGGCEREGVPVCVIVCISGYERGWRVGHPGRGNLCEYLGICKGWRMWKHACYAASAVEHSCSVCMCARTCVCCNDSSAVEHSGILQRCAYAFITRCHCLSLFVYLSLSLFSSVSASVSPSPSPYLSLFLPLPLPLPLTVSVRVHFRYFSASQVQVLTGAQDHDPG
jgi:hypothetical protein